jgi:hypothetical protein
MWRKLQSFSGFLRSLCTVTHSCVAEREGFEPSVPARGTTVFETKTVRVTSFSDIVKHLILLLVHMETTSDTSDVVDQFVDSLVDSVVAGRGRPSGRMSTVYRAQRHSGRSQQNCCSQELFE